MKRIAYYSIALLLTGTIHAYAADTKLREPSSIDCSNTVKKAAVRKASESLQNCKASEPKAKVSRGIESSYHVAVRCPAFKGDVSEYVFNVTVKVAFATGTGKAVCFASQVEPDTAPSDAVGN